MNTEIQKIPLKELVVDIGLSGRSQKEINQNAKSLSPEIKAAKGWDRAQPGQFFTRNGERHLAAGFTRKAASELEGFDFGYFVEVKDEPEKLRTAAIRTNSGKPISAYEQGRIYIQMRDGTPEEQSKNAEKGAIIFGQMTTTEIATEVGKTKQHIENCIAIFSETPEIGELLEQGLVSANVVVRAQQLVKADGKRFSMLKAAIAQAKEDGKECATPKHLAAVQSRFVPVKAGKGPNSDPANGTGGTTNPGPKGPATSAPAPVNTPPQHQPGLENLGGAAEGEKEETKANRDELVGQFRFAVDKWAKDREIAVSDEDMDALLPQLAAIAGPF